MNLAIYIEGQRLDLFDYEEVSVTQNVKDLKDISKVRTDYSQQFTVPASAKNNQIFKHFYNADIDNGFDARIRANGTIVIGSFDFKVGKVRLDGANLKNGKPQNYKITFFGKAIDIKDLIGDDLLSELDWLDNFDTNTSVYDLFRFGESYTVDGVSYPTAVIYPLISYKRQYYYNSDPSDTTNTDVSVNIANNNSAMKGVDAKDLKPAIRLHVVLEAIEKKYGINFTSPFFDSGIFKAIYMNLNKDVEDNVRIVEDLGSATFDKLSVDFYYTLESNVVVSGSATYKVRMTLNDNVVYESAIFNTSKTFVATINEWNVVLTGNVAKWEIIAYSGITYTATQSVIAYAFGSTELYNNTVSNSVGQFLQIRNQLPEIKTYDFLKCIIEKFNLIATADGDSIFIDNLTDWYQSGNIYDITQYVDTETEQVSRGNILKNISFKFKETEQLIAEQYRKSNRIGYGDLDFRLADKQGNDLRDVDGDDLEVESIFVNPIFERLTDQIDGQLTSIQYCPFFNSQFEKIGNETFLFFNIYRGASSNRFNFIENGVKYVRSASRVPSHSIEIDVDSFNLNFGQVANEYSYQFYNDTIYQRYWSDYISDIFSVKRRIYKFKAKLPDSLLLRLKLNDRLIIKGRRYIISRLTSNLNKRSDDLELINDIYDIPLVTDVLSKNAFETNVQSKSAENTDLQTIKFTGDGGLPITTADSWVDLQTTETNQGVTEIEYALDNNPTGDIRVGTITVDGTIEFKILQQGYPIGKLDLSDKNQTVLATNLITIKP